MVEFLAYSGMRIGEAREIRRRGINLDQATIRITGGDIGTKTHRERTIPIFPNLQRQLDRIFSRNLELLPSSRIFHIRTPRKARCSGLRAENHLSSFRARCRNVRVYHNAISPRWVLVAQLHMPCRREIWLPRIADAIQEEAHQQGVTTRLEW
jgi:integrase